MDKELNIGDEVLIFNYIPEWGIQQNYEQFIKGKVIKSEMSDNLSYHGSSWHVKNYRVLGEDDKEYYGNYKHPHLGNSFFMTIEDYIYYLKSKIINNKEEILKLNIENRKYNSLIRTIETHQIDEVAKMKGR